MDAWPGGERNVTKPPDRLGNTGVSPARTRPKRVTRAR